MDKKKLRKISQRIDQLRARSASVRSSELKGIARQLGRRLRKQQTGEPPYVSTLLPNSRPISIPDHPGAMNKFVVGDILDDFEDDIFALEQQLEASEKPAKK